MFKASLDRVRHLNKRWLLLALAAGALALGLVGLGLGGALGRAAQRDQTWERIQRTGVLRVGMDASYPPFENVDAAGQFVGLDVDLAAALAHRWGVQVQYVNVHLDGLYDGLRSDKFDLIISALPYDRTLTRDVRYSSSYFNAGQVLLVRQTNVPANSLADLGTGRVAVELGSEGHQLLRQLARDQGIQVEVAALREPEQVLDELRSGQAVATVCDRVTAYSYLQQVEGLEIVGVPLSDEPYVMAASREASELMDQVEEALAEWQADGSLDELQQRWFE